MFKLTKPRRKSDFLPMKNFFSSKMLISVNLTQVYLNLNNKKVIKNTSTIFLTGHTVCGAVAGGNLSPIGRKSKSHQFFKYYMY